MTNPTSDPYWCKTCQVHRTSAAERECPCCAPNPKPKFPGPPSRLALDRPISTTSGDL